MRGNAEVDITFLSAVCMTLLKMQEEYCTCSCPCFYSCLYSYDVSKICPEIGSLTAFLSSCAYRSLLYFCVYVYLLGF